jgi:putative transposase
MKANTNDGGDMAHSLRQIYIHLIWSTKGRAPVIKGDLERFIHRRLREIAADLDLRMVAVNSAWDHTHSLVEWNTSITFARAIKEMKSRTSVEWLQRQRERGITSSFKWQRGGGIWSVDKRRVPRLSKYIADQKDIHRKRRA